MLKLIIILSSVILQLNCQYYNSYDYQYTDHNTSDVDYYDHDTDANWRKGFQNNSAVWDLDDIADTIMDNYANYSDSKNITNSGSVKLQKLTGMIIIMIYKLFNKYT